MLRFGGQVLVFSPLNLNCLQEFVMSLYCSQRTCWERNLLEMLSIPGIAGLDADWVPQPRILRLKLSSHLVPGLCQ